MSAPFGGRLLHTLPDFVRILGESSVVSGGSWWWQQVFPRLKIWFALIKIGRKLKLVLASSEVPASPVHCSGIRCKLESATESFSGEEYIFVSLGTI